MLVRLSLLEQLDEKQHRTELLKETTCVMRHRQFGANDKKHSDQGELFNEVELLLASKKRRRYRYPSLCCHPTRYH